MTDEREPAGDQPEPVPQSPPTPPAGQEQDAAQAATESVAESVWDPWAPRPADQAPEQAIEHTVEHTMPVDLSHTQELRGSDPGAVGMPGQSATSGTSDPYGAPGSGTAWASEATGWPASAPPTGQHPPNTQVGQGLPTAAGWDPFTSQHADAGFPGAPAPWVGGRPATQTAPQGKGPGWGALVAVAVVAALVAAALGGLFGGWLGATGRVDFAGGDTSSIPQAGAGATARPEGSIASIAAKALPSVVTIKVKGADGSGTGSGFVLDHEGHIITNNHVVAGAADGGSIKVELSNGTEISATIAGRDGSYDLAVLKTGRSDLQPLVMGSSKDVVVGDQVIAVGAPLGLESSVTAGIVSALNRPVSPGGDGDQQAFINAIQTDAAINPGNSGGPLLDMQGHVIGVNSAIARVPGSTDTQSGNIGVGFSIPSDQVVKTAEQLIRTGKAQHPIIGVVLDRQYTGEGVRVLPKESSDSGKPVSPGGPADKAGIKPGDIILEFDGRKVNDPDNLVVAIRAKSVGDQVSLKVRRGSQTISVRLTLSGTSGN
jgi:putative serine protease PepD